MLIEQLVGETEVRFGLLHSREVQKHERLPQVMIGAEASYRARRRADDRAGFAVPHALPIRSGPDVQGVLESSRNGAIVLGRHEQDRVATRGALAERRPLGRRLVVEILIVKLQLPDFDDA